MPSWLFVEWWILTKLTLKTLCLWVLKCVCGSVWLFELYILKRKLTVVTDSPKSRGPCHVVVELPVPISNTFLDCCWPPMTWEAVAQTPKPTGYVAVLTVTPPPPHCCRRYSFGAYLESKKNKIIINSWNPVQTDNCNKPITPRAATCECMWTLHQGQATWVKLHAASLLFL